MKEFIFNIICGLLLGLIIMVGSRLAIYGITPFYRVFGCIILIFMVVEMCFMIRG